MTRISSALRVILNWRRQAQTPTEIREEYIKKRKTKYYYKGNEVVNHSLDVLGCISLLKGGSRFCMGMFVATAQFTSQIKKKRSSVRISLDVPYNPVGAFSTRKPRHVITWLGQWNRASLSWTKPDSWTQVEGVCPVQPDLTPRNNGEGERTKSLGYAHCAL